LSVRSSPDCKIGESLTDSVELIDLRKMREEIMPKVEIDKVNDEHTEVLIIDD